MRPMDIETYISQHQKRLDRSARRIKDFKVFDFNYIPDKPLMRKEVKPVVNGLLRYRHSGIPNHLLILGARGSGKSLMARYLARIMRQEETFQFDYVNCRQARTSFKILAHLLNIQARGSSLDELWLRFEKSRTGKTVLILDEVDLISEKDRHKEILYLISRSPRNYMTILLSNNPKIISKLDESIRSTLQPETVHFRNYDALEITDILKERARIGLHDIPTAQIKEIAALTCRSTNSDIRVSIKALYRWAIEPSVNVKEHFDKARRDVVFDVVRDLNDKNLLMLQAILGHSGGFVKEVYQAYRKISVQCHEEPYSYMHFYSNLSYLQSLGLLVLVSTKVDRTYANKVQLTFDPTILRTILGHRFS